MVAVFSGLARLFVELGLGSAIIRSKRLSSTQLSTVFLNLASGLTMTLLFVAVSPWIAAYYDNPEVAPLNIWLGGAFALNSLSVVHRNSAGASASGASASGSGAPASKHSSSPLGGAVKPYSKQVSGTSPAQPATGSVSDAYLQPTTSCELAS